ETLNFPEFSSSGVVSASTRFNGGPGSSGDMIDEAPIDAAPWPPEEVPFEEPPLEEAQRGEIQSADQAAATPRELVNQYRQILADDPEGALADLGIAAVSAGSAEGYRLDSLSANSPYLQQTGLQPGDVILSVNGQAVGDIQRDQQQIDSVLSQGSARLEVQRGSRRFFVTASLNQ
ncbi:MAG: PDZ domain-containing protein, partial [Pseudomonadales bacterium]|nr:PDZ domain-containing protein [Pseudomonadales bacterium]